MTTQNWADYWARGRHLREQARERAGRARAQLVVSALLAAGMLVLYSYRRELFGASVGIRVGIAVVLIGLCWPLAQSLTRAIAPWMLRRMDASTAGTVEFVVRLVLVVGFIILALDLAGLKTQTLAVGGAATAVLLGLAAQQTIGNVFAGMVLLSAHPFRVGDRVRFQAGALAGGTEGTVRQLGLLYTTMTSGAETIMVPNSLVINSAIVPLNQPAAVDVRARLRPDVTPSRLQAMLDANVTVPTSEAPFIDLEEVDDEQVVVRISATPASADEGSRLADQIITSVAEMGGDGAEREGGREREPAVAGAR